MKLTWNTFVSTLACLLAVPAVGMAADRHPDGPGYASHGDRVEGFSRRNLYFGFGTLSGIENFDVPAQSPAGFPTSAGDVDVDPGWGADGRIGYRFHDYLAAELQGQYNGTFPVSCATCAGELRLGDVQLASGTANLKFLPLQGRFQPYLLGGIGVMWGSTKNRAVGAKLPSNNYEFVGRTGLGMDVYIWPELSVNAEATYLLPAGTLDDYQTAAALLGVQWHFAQ